MFPMEETHRLMGEYCASEKIATSMQNFKYGRTGWVYE
jgi:hypothetical protein